MNASNTLRRVQVQKYSKSGKLAAIFVNERFSVVTVLELSEDMSMITQIRYPKFVRKHSVEGTRYNVEIIEKVGEIIDGQTMVAFELLRVLSPEDMDQERWKTAISLDDVPVSSHEDLTIEERVWAGERAGNFGGGILLGVATVGALLISRHNYMPDGFVYVVFALIAAFLSWRFVKYPWKKSVAPSQSKFEQLETYKRNLREKNSIRKADAKLSFEKALEDYDYWKYLSPRDFEHAISFRLNKEGFTAKTTQYSSDGGVDIEAVDERGHPVIVQAKRYRENVGVAIVREMIGVWVSHSDEPRTIIFSLVGFTKGARQLADENGIELRSIKSEILKI